MRRIKWRATLVAIAWGIFVFLAVSTGLGALRYALPNVPFPAPLANFTTRHGWLVIHAVCSAVALIVGPWQFFASWRRHSLGVHRWMGRIYCGAVLAGWIASLPIAAHAETGVIASVGFLILGVLWAGTTTIGYFTARSGPVRVHREWMIRSYALTSAAVTLRIYLPVLLSSGVSYKIAYPLVAWLCWIPNLVFAQWLILRVKGRTVRHASKEKMQSAYRPSSG